MPLDIKIASGLLVGCFIWLCGFYAGLKKGAQQRGTE